MRICERGLHLLHDNLMMVLIFLTEHNFLFNVFFSLNCKFAIITELGNFQNYWWKTIHLSKLIVKYYAGKNVCIGSNFGTDRDVEKFEVDKVKNTEWIISI